MLWLLASSQMALYGLKQAPRAYNRRLTQELEDVTFTALDIHFSLLIAQLKTGTVYSLV